MAANVSAELSLKYKIYVQLPLVWKQAFAVFVNKIARINRLEGIAKSNITIVISKRIIDKIDFP